jgi:hypothetical protein
MVNKEQENKLREDQINLLINKGIIKKDIFIKIFEDDYDYRITNIDGNSFTIFNIDTKESKNISYKNIRIIEDMDIYRFIKAYEVDDALSTLNITLRTNVLKDVIGKEYAKITGIELENDMKIILHNDLTKNLNDKILTVRDVGSSIKLVAPRGRPKKK